MTYYVSPRFLDKLAVHITKNYLDLPQVKVPLILGVHGRKGEGKTFQCELVFERMGVEVIYISGGELESPDAGDPARLVRLRYREAAELVRVRGKMAVLMINDLDAGAGRFDRMTQYTVNTQLVNNTLMNIADNPTNVQLPGSYDEKPLPRIPIIATGNDFATLYAPLIRDGRMQKFYWEPSEEDRLGIVSGMFSEDGLSRTDAKTFVKRFSSQAIDFFSAVRSQLYDDQISDFIRSVGVENVAAQVVNSLRVPTFPKPSFTLDTLIETGENLVREQRRVQTMGLVSEYNQAITPSHRVSESSRRDSALLTPPAHNPLRPYRLGKRDAKVAEEGQENNVSVMPQDYRESAGPVSNGLDSEIAQTLQGILAQGHRIGIEHAEPREFRTNAWQCYASVDANDEKGAITALKECLRETPNQYVRLITVDSQTKRRMNEVIIQRPSFM